MTVQRYVHDILQPHVLPIMQRFTGAIFQQDNPRPLTARVSQDCLHTVVTLPWPARCPDLSPIEHICDPLGWRVGHPTSLNELEARLQKIWSEVVEDIVQNLYASMPDRIVSCICARGGLTGSPPGGAIAYQLQHHTINRQVANKVATSDVNLALSPTFRCFY
ncbi:transposable element Tcb1 transposase [Trichonephila clavipes]|nr:transposable element Tcb1 transposase [Trichonephila clavipes]